MLRRAAIISLFPGVRIQTQKNVFSFLRNESVDRSSYTSVVSLFHARGAATEEALSPHDESALIHVFSSVFTRGRRL